MFSENIDIDTICIYKYNKKIQIVSNFVKWKEQLHIWTWTPSLFPVNG